MKYALMIFVMFLTACSTNEEDSRTSYKPADKDTTKPLLIGDSRCIDNEYIPERDCSGSLALIDVGGLDNDYPKTIIALGINDMARGVDVKVYKAHLEHLIAMYDGEVWCLLESTFNYINAPEIVQASRQAMIDVCPNTLDPNIDPFDSDRVHYTDYNYQQVKAAYDSIL